MDNFFKKIGKRFLKNFMGFPFEKIWTKNTLILLKKETYVEKKKLGKERLFWRKRLLKEKVHRFYFQKEKGLSSKKSTIFKKRDIHFRNFGHSKYFFYHFFFKFQRGKRNFFLNNFFLKNKLFLDLRKQKIKKTFIKIKKKKNVLRGEKWFFFKAFLEKMFKGRFLKKRFYFRKNLLEKRIKYLRKKTISLEKHNKRICFTQAIDLWQHYQ